MAMSKLKSIVRIIIILSATIFFGELAIMYALSSVDIQNKTIENFLDAGALLVIVFPVLYFFSIKSMLLNQQRLEVSVRERTADIEVARDRLEEAVEELKARQQQILWLGEMGNFFQSCRNLPEAMAVVEARLPRLFPEMSGSLFLLNSSRNILEKKAAWGLSGKVPEHYSPDDCWALRRTKPHIVVEADSAIACRHMHTVPATSQICLPLTAQGQSLGVLCLAKQASATNGDNFHDGGELEFYEATSENLALAIANLQLQEKLSHQALRDSLTGLYNRRYLLDALARELDRASAYNNAVSVVMIDIDYFKRFNDSFGHAAGDAVLARLGTALREGTLPDDIPARFGGEEFTLVLPNTPAELAYSRMETLRQKIEDLTISHVGNLLPHVTISVGIATFPHHGVDGETLIESADQALYQSKRDGRNRSTMACEAMSGRVRSLPACA